MLRNSRYIQPCMFKRLRNFLYDKPFGQRIINRLQENAAAICFPLSLITCRWRLEIQAKAIVNATSCCYHHAEAAKLFPGRWLMIGETRLAQADRGKMATFFPVWWFTGCNQRGKLFRFAQKSIQLNTQLGTQTEWWKTCLIGMGN